MEIVMEILLGMFPETVLEILLKTVPEIVFLAVGP
jgi:hypothetical protein